MLWILECVDITSNIQTVGCRTLGVAEAHVTAAEGIARVFFEVLYQGLCPGDRADLNLEMIYHPEVGTKVETSLITC